MRAEARVEQVVVEGLPIAYSRRGAGPPLLLVHGLLDDRGVWRALVDVLAEHFDCIALDLPGSGASAKPPGKTFAYRIADLAAVVEAFAGQVGLKRFDLAGHSMGGGVALRLAATRPALIRRLTLIDPLGLPFPWPLEAWPLQLPGLGRALFVHLYGWRMFRRYFRERVFHKPARIDEDRLRSLYGHFDSPGGREAAYRATLEVFRAQPVRTLAAQVRAPTLLVWGRHDRIFPLSLAEPLRSCLPDAQLRVVEDCGHAPLEEAAEQVWPMLLAHHGTGMDPDAQPIGADGASSAGQRLAR